MKFIDQYRESIKINSIVRIEVLRKRKYDTNSDVLNVLGLLEEYVNFRKENKFEKIIESLQIKDYSTEFIRNYLSDSTKLNKRDRNKFEAVLREEKLDLLYLKFLDKYRGEKDLFGVVIDRDCDTHTKKQMDYVLEKCKERNYLCYISNPCIEIKLPQSHWL